MNRFKESKIMAVDIETKDPGLLTYGPGTHRGEGYICGIAFGVKDKDKHYGSYLSLAHPDTPADVRESNRKIAAELLATNIPKVGANIAYDLEWMDHEGIKTNGVIHDVEYAEPLLNEYSRSYSLDSIASKYHLRAKKTDILEKYNSTMGWKEKPIENIWRMPERVAREYALIDVELPLDILEKQYTHLETQNLVDLYRMECDLIPSILHMRRNGVRLDMPLFKRTIAEVTNKHFELKEQLFKWAGRQFNPGSTAQIAEIFDSMGIPYPRNEPTPKMKDAGKIGNPNLDKRVLHILSDRHPICKTLLEFRHFETMINLFLSKYAEFNVDGRLYGQLHPLRTDEYGTVSGRFSASKPNLQQVSAKKEDADAAEEVMLSVLKGQIIRKFFIPEEGHRWAKLDYSQIEYRIMAHYATGTGAEELRKSYQQNKNMDYHQRVMDATSFDRRTSKNVNFGGMYGIGAASAARLFGWTMEEAELFLGTYHKNAPYIRKTRDAVSNAAARRGYIFTLLGRKARTHTSRKLYSMFNRLIQGSAADIMKKSMVDAEKKGLFDVLKLHMTVHDELDVSYKDNKEGNEALKELTHTMETTVKLDVPILVDCHTGTNWAEAD